MSDTSCLTLRSRCHLQPQLNWRDSTLQNNSAMKVNVCFSRGSEPHKSTARQSPVEKEAPAMSRLTAESTHFICYGLRRKAYKLHFIGVSCPSSLCCNRTAELGDRTKLFCPFPLHIPHYFYFGLKRSDHEADYIFTFTSTCAIHL